MGGDCLNYGCVPSKALLAAAHAADAMRHAGRFGVDGHVPEVDFGRVHDHVHEVIAAIAPLDSQERFEGLGVTVIRAHAQLLRTGRDRGGRRPGPRQAVRARHRQPAGSAADPGPRSDPLSDQRDDLRGPRGARSSGRDRRRADRLRARAGAPAAGLGRDRPGHGADPAEGRPGADRGRALEPRGRRHRFARAGPGAGGRARRQRRRGRPVRPGRRRRRAHRGLRSAGGCWPGTRGPGHEPRAGRGRLRPPRHQGRRQAAHDQQENLRDRRCDRRLSVHPCRQAITPAS